MNVITITLNPSLDKTLILDAIHVNELNRVVSIREDAGGKGINISRNLMCWGIDSIALGFVGGYIGNHLTHILEQEKIKTDFVHVKENTRVNLKIKTQENYLTEINEPGPTINEEHVNQLLKKLKKHVKKDCIVVLSGSAPSSINPKLYADIIQLAKSYQASVILDADKKAFELGVLAKPTLIKPNEKEVAWFLNKEEVSLKDCLIQAHNWIKDGIEHVVISRGSKGAIFVNQETVYELDGLKVNLVNPTGAGDAMVSGMIYGLLNKYSTQETYRFALAASAATVETAGTTPALLDRIQEKVEEIKRKEGLK